MMAKDTFLVFDEWDTNCEDLTDEEFGKLMRAVFQYARTGEIPDFEDRTLRSCWRPIQNSFDRASGAYEQRCEKNRENGKKGGRPPKTETEKNPKKAKKPNAFFGYFEKTEKTLPNPHPNPNPNPHRGGIEDTTTTTENDLLSVWNQQQCTNPIQSVTEPQKRNDRIEMAVAVAGGNEAFLDIVQSLDQQAYFKDHPVDFDWFVDPVNFQKIMEGKYAEAFTKKKKSGFQNFDERTYSEEQMKALEQKMGGL